MKHLEQHRTATSSRISHRDLSILVAEDDNYLRRLLQMSLQQDGYEPTLVRTGREALDHFGTDTYDLVMLDIQMPEMNGIEVCERIRQMSDVPIIMITALDRPNDIVRSLEVGADDYVTKPFNFRVLQARVQAILRRISWQEEKPEPTILTIGDVTLNDETREVFIGTSPIHLTATEYKLLRYLMLHYGETVSQVEILRDIWQVDNQRKNSVLEAAIRRLRQKIEPDAANPHYIVTVVGHGYKFQTATDESVLVTPPLSREASAATATASDIEFRENSNNILVRGGRIHLSNIEHRLFSCFWRHRDRTLDKETLALEVWGTTSASMGAMVTATVQRLRRKIEVEPAQPRYIVTVRGEGYRFCSDGQGW